MLRLIKKFIRLIKKFRKLFYVGMQYFSTKTISDGFINWLIFANAGMLNRGNIYAMKYAVDNLPSTNPVLEIGSFCGLSTNLIGYLLQTSGKKNRIFSCDKWFFEGAEMSRNIGESEISFRQYREFVKANFIRNVEFFSPHNKPYTVEAFSDDFFKLWEKNETVSDVFGRNIQLGGKISFGYIDGNHNYNFVKRDFENLDRYLETGGYVLFDDSSDSDSFGLTRLMKEIKQKINYELVMKNPNYLFKKIT